MARFQPRKRDFAALGLVAFTIIWMQYEWLRFGLGWAGSLTDFVARAVTGTLVLAMFLTVIRMRARYFRYHRRYYILFSVFVGVSIAALIFQVLGLALGLARMMGVSDAAVAIARPLLWLVSGWVVVQGFGEALYRVHRPTVRIDVAAMPTATPPLKIAQISDLHIGSHMHGDRLARYVGHVNALGADMIVITGDIIDINPHYVHEGFPILAGLNAPLGVYAILGNHDFYAGADKVEAGLAKYTRIQLLRDRWVEIRGGDAPVHLIGIDDPVYDWARKLNPAAWSHLDKAMEGLPPNGTRILLSHRPDVAKVAADRGIDLVLSGHTHGGQFEIPGIFNLARVITPYPRGHYRISDRTHLYTNPGLGLVLAPFRFLVPREITQLVVAPAGQGAG